MKSLVAILVVVELAGCAASTGGPLPAPAVSAAAVAAVAVPGTPAPCVTALPTTAFGPDGLPLPGAIALGKRLTDLPLKQHRALMGDGASLLATHVQLVEAGGSKIRLALDGQERVVAAQVTAPGGLDDVAVAAWLQAIVPCAPKAYVAPRRQDRPGTWSITVGQPATGAKLGDEVELEAVPDAQAASWLKGRLDALGASSPPDVPAGPGRWQAVGASWITYGK